MVLWDLMLGRKISPLNMDARGSYKTAGSIYKATQSHSQETRVSIYTAWVSAVFVKKIDCHMKVQ